MKYIKQFVLIIVGSVFYTGAANADQVILDDLIVDGSACVGFDCLNGESFGFDTIRIKENNLRIRGVDTSNSASFPSRDWQITFNDSANGGANKFSIDDIDGGRTPFTIEAGAPSHSLYVDDGGRLGLGTSTPVVDVHVKSGNTPTLRLEQDGSSGFTPQTWDVAGNEANFFIRDATNGSQLPFKIKPGAPSDAIFMAASGNVGLGSTSPDRHLDIEADGPGMRFTNTGSGGGGFDIVVNGGNSRFFIKDVSTNSTPFKLENGANENALRIGQESNGTTAANFVAVGDVNGASAILDVFGAIRVGGSTVHPDFVFEQDYDLQSIKERKEYMWEQKHLPALPKAPEGLTGPVDLVGHQMGVLEEVEVAHIYIQQLLESIEKLEARVEKMEQDSTQ